MTSGSGRNEAHLSAGNAPEMVPATHRNRLRFLIAIVIVTQGLLLPMYLLLLLWFGRVARAPEASNEGIASTEVATLSQALAQYVADEGDLPRREFGPDSSRNDFPVLFEALFGQRRPIGKGGRNAPYAEFKENKVAVEEPETKSYRKATPAEIHDPGVKKYCLDPWGNPYIYRAGKTLTDSKIYSLGWNEQDDTMDHVEDGDDIGNW